MHSATPQLPAFLDFISLLESKGCVERVSGTSKKSKRVLRLTAQARKSIESHLKKVQ
jgi:DNA-binding MarR family transcriptional regulator